MRLWLVPHAIVDCLAVLRGQYPTEMANPKNIGGVLIEMGQIGYSHGWWKATRPLTSTGAQMSNAYVAATYLVDNAVVPTGFSSDKLERDEIWDLVDVTQCRHNPDLDSSGGQFKTRVTVTFKDGTAPISYDKGAARGNDPSLTNSEILDKFRGITKGVLDDDRRRKIEGLVLNLEACEDVVALSEIMSPISTSPIA